MTSAVRTLVSQFAQRHPEEAALEMQAQNPARVATMLAEQTPGTAAGILRRMQHDRAAQVLGAADEAAVPRLVSELDPAHAAHLLARLPEEPRARALQAVPDSLAAEIRDILSFPPGTAGSVMDARVALFTQDTLVRDALERIRELRDRRVADLVMVDRAGTYAGMVRLQDVVGADPDQQLAEIPRPLTAFVHPMTPREEVVELLQEYRLSSLPVVDLQNHVVGVIRHAGLVEAAQQDAITDLQQMVGGSKEERALSSPWVGVKSRLPWLNINLVTAFLAASVVGLFESTIARFTAVAVLLPVVAGQSGNTGAQALAVTMRGLALREIRVSQGFRVLVKELIVGLVNGVAIAIVTSIGVYAWSRNLGLALVMLLAMIVSMVAASAAGALIPIALVKAKRDPATASSIILTTVTDIVGFFTFLGLATLLASMLAGSQ